MSIINIHNWQQIIYIVASCWFSFLMLDDPVSTFPFVKPSLNQLAPIPWMPQKWSFDKISQVCCTIQWLLYCHNVHQNALNTCNPWMVLQMCHLRYNECTASGMNGIYYGSIHKNSSNNLGPNACVHVNYFGTQSISPIFCSHLLATVKITPITLPTPAARVRSYKSF